MRKTKMVIRDHLTDGMVPVDVSVLADNMNLIIQWNGCDLEIPIDDVMTVLVEDDGK